MEQEKSESERLGKPVKLEFREVEWFYFSHAGSSKLVPKRIAKMGWTL